MECPNCGFIKNKVVNSRVAINGDIRRRRECLRCTFRWSTLEDYEDLVADFKKFKREGGQRWQNS